jgi:hypothetical protein
MVSGVSIKFLHTELAICRDIGTWNIVYIIPPDIRVIGLSFSKLEAYFMVATFSDKKSMVSSISEIGTT